MSSLYDLNFGSLQAPQQMDENGKPIQDFDTFYHPSLQHNETQQLMDFYHPGHSSGTGVAALLKMFI